MTAFLLLAPLALGWVLGVACERPRKLKTGVIRSRQIIKVFRNASRP